jgi:hypothetical protein
MPVKHHKGCEIERSPNGDYAQIRQLGVHLKSFYGHKSFEDAKRWIDEQIAIDELAQKEMTQCPYFNPALWLS